MHSVGDCLEQAQQCVDEDQQRVAREWLKEVEAHWDFTTGSERKRFFSLVDQLQKIPALV